MLYSNLIDSIGNTPLVHVDFGMHPQLFAKLEYLNPGGSVKDRSSRYMIEQAEKTGKLKPGMIIIDASSGNQGIAMAMIGAAKGYKVIITVSEKISKEKLKTIQAYGAQTVMCPATKFLDDPESYHSVAKRLHQETPHSFMPDQYHSLENAHAHYHSLGPEIWQQTKGKITHFFAASGTCGTICGAGRYLKEQNPNIKILAVDAINSWHATSGHPKPYKVEGMGIDFETPILDESLIDEFLLVNDENSFAMLKKLAHTYGLLAGPSSGSVAFAAHNYLKDKKEDSCAVMIFGDSGRAYLTKNLY